MAPMISACRLIRRDRSWASRAVILQPADESFSAAAPIMIFLDHPDHAVNACPPLKGSAGLQGEVSHPRRLGSRSGASWVIQ
jgi:hypothetical protein